MDRNYYVELISRANKGDKAAQEELEKRKSSSGSEIQEGFNQFGNWIANGWNWLTDKASRLFKGLTGETSAQATLDANERNIANQNYWNEISMQREDSAHQREMADLQAAGLNPWLSVGGGGAQASTMSTAQAEPVDGSKMLQATSAMALLAVTRLLSRSTSRTSTTTIYRK